jgi:G:T-mismatch repair DNA endonuclease (very short patch repair protein)
MRIYWTKEEEDELRHYYENLGLSVSELYNDFIKKYPYRTIVSLELKIVKLKLRHTKDQKFQIKSRLNTGENNGMFGKKGPNKGLTKANSERIKNSSEKISKSRKEMSKCGLLPSTAGEKNGMFGKEPWNKGETKYTNNSLLEAGLKQSKFRKEYWESLSDEQKDKIIGDLSLAANKAKKDTKIEIIVKEVLDKLNINYIKNFRCDRYIFDFYLLDYNFVIECQGDYWHGNKEYFKDLNEMQLKNIERDKNKIEYLEKNNIKSLFLWENEIYRFKTNLDKIILDKVNE